MSSPTRDEQQGRRQEDPRPRALLDAPTLGRVRLARQPEADAEDGRRHDGGQQHARAVARADVAAAPGPERATRRRRRTRTDSGAIAAPSRHRPTSPNSTTPTPTQIHSFAQSNAGQADSSNGVGREHAEGREADDGERQAGELLARRAEQEHDEASAPPPISPHSRPLTSNGCVRQPVMSSKTPCPENSTRSSYSDRSSAVGLEHAEPEEPDDRAEERVEARPVRVGLVEQEVGADPQRRRSGRRRGRP